MFIQSIYVFNIFEHFVFSLRIHHNVSQQVYSESNEQHSSKSHLQHARSSEHFKLKKAVIKTINSKFITRT